MSSDVQLGQCRRWDMVSSPLQSFAVRCDPCSLAFLWLAMGRSMLRYSGGTVRSQHLYKRRALLDPRYWAVRRPCNPARSCGSSRPPQSTAGYCNPCSSLQPLQSCVSVVGERGSLTYSRGVVGSQPLYKRGEPLQCPVFLWFLQSKFQRSSLEE